MVAVALKSSFGSASSNTSPWCYFSLVTAFVLGLKAQVHSSHCYPCFDP